MKIAQIAPAWVSIPPKNYGGTENVIYHLVEEQVAEGHTVTLFTTGDAKTSAQQVSFVPHALLDEGVPWNDHWRAYYHLHKAICYVQEHAEDFDIVHTHVSSASDLYLFPLLATLSVPHITTLHSNLPFEKTPRHAADERLYFTEWASSVPMIAISESTRKLQPKQLQFVGVVHHGLPVDVYAPRRKKPEAYFAWLGRFSPEKGAHLAIEAAKRTGVPLVLAGTIDRSSKQATAYFYDAIKPQIDEQQIRYLGPVNQRRKVSLLSRARGFLNPIEWEEPFGMVMIEAMATGCPVISFARGAAPEIIAHEKTGFLVQDVEEMIQCISRIDELDRTVVRQHVEEHFSARVMARKYVQVYKNVQEMGKERLASLA